MHNYGHSRYKLPPVPADEEHSQAGILQPVHMHATSITLRWMQATRKHLNRMSADEGPSQAGILQPGPTPVQVAIMAEAVKVERAFLAPVSGRRSDLSAQPYAAYEDPDGGDPATARQQAAFAWPHHGFELYSRHVTWK